METYTMAVFFRTYCLPILLSLTGVALVSCSVSDDDQADAEAPRIIISGHVLEKLTGTPIGGERILMTRLPDPGTAPGVMAVPDTAWTTSGGYYSFETELRSETERFDLQAGAAFNYVTISRGDNSYDADLGCYVLQDVDFFL